MRVVVEDVLPLMGTADVVRNRQGAIEAISCIFFLMFFQGSREERTGSSSERKKENEVKRFIQVALKCTVQPHNHGFH